MRVFTESDVENGNNNYSFAGPNTVEAKAWHSHPQFTEAQFFLHDVGVVELKNAVNLPASAYGTLPSVNQFDALKSSSSTLFTAVGYGVQRINPAKEVAEKIRMVATPHLVQINTGYTGSFSMLLLNNASTGGTCFGDSGGPNFLGASSVVAGVTSFGNNGTCGGTGGVFRLDRADVLAFVQQYLK
jgi:secreted trypsin-like serine protease